VTPRTRLKGGSLAKRTDAGGPLDRSSSIALSIPPALRDRIAGVVPFLRTYDAFAGLFAGAKRSLKILAPYVDPSFTALLALTNARVQVLTTAGEGRGMRASPVLERCASLRPVTVRYLTERRDRALLYQMHAKMILADSERAYVGTANLTDTSIHYNLELGLLVEDRRTVAELIRLFDSLFERVGVPARLI
jgi:phosphatidylserine/phosphatidylglycerophosphate/cardiolipin synthase-like enzyme